MHEPQRRSYQNPIYDSVVYVVFSKGWFLEIKTYNQPLGGHQSKDGLFFPILKKLLRSAPKIIVSWNLAWQFLRNLENMSKNIIWIIHRFIDDILFRPCKVSVGKPSSFDNVCAVSSVKHGGGGMMIFACLVVMGPDYELLCVLKYSSEAKRVSNWLKQLGNEPKDSNKPTTAWLKRKKIKE